MFDVYHGPDVVRNRLTKKLMPKLHGRILEADRHSVFGYEYIVSNKINFNKHRMPFNEKIFDFVLSLEVLEHLQNHLYYLEECHRILNDDGKLILTTPRGNLPAFMWPEYHYHELNRPRLIELLEMAGFEIIKVEIFNKSLFWYLKTGVCRPLLRYLFRGWFYIEAMK